MNKIQLVISFVEDYQPIISVGISIILMLCRIIKKFNNSTNIHKRFIYKNKDKYIKYEADTTEKWFYNPMKHTIHIVRE